MSQRLIDEEARRRFRTEWNRNFAVSANAGSGKTTAISERLAAMALASDGATLLPKTAVVTFTKKAAAQIGQRARDVLMRELAKSMERPAGETADRAALAPLDHLERAFFGTIHSFCLLLARRYGQALGINLSPTLVEENDDELWEEFIEQDAMQFRALAPAHVDAFLRHVPLEAIFDLARGLQPGAARHLAERKPLSGPPRPNSALLENLLAIAPKGAPAARKNLEQSQRTAREWARVFQEETGFLPLYEPASKSAGVVELAELWMQPLKRWLADAGAVLAAELAERYRAYRFERGVQTYADQIEAALAVLQDPPTLEKIRAEGWRVILDEAQDTDPQQFAVLVEIARPLGSTLGEWPGGAGPGPRAGHFCMVGDGQQAIYGSRADIRNFLRHVDAFAGGRDGELLTFQVTFRSPRRVITFLNAGFPSACGPDREHNYGLPVADNAPAPFLQVQYEALAPGPENVEGAASRLPIEQPEKKPAGVDAWLAEEARQVAAFLKRHGPAGVGARAWGEICLLAPRNDWLNTARRALDAAGLKTALQVRRSKNRENAAYAWLTGLLAAVCDPENTFEWFGVLREVFAVSDELLAAELRRHGEFRWESPEDHPEPLAQALTLLRPWVLSVDDEARMLGEFAQGLVDTGDLRAKAALLDPNGGLTEELDRQLVQAAALGSQGGTPRQWLRVLLEGLDRSRPAGKAEEDAINLLTSHSAKGLEWPVVIPLGIWRAIGKPPETGLRVVSDGRGQTLVYFDTSSLPADARLARERERLRELVRLFYVTLTRTRRHLVIPWHAEFGGRRKTGSSFAELWGADELLNALPTLDGRSLIENTVVQERERRRHLAYEVRPIKGGRDFPRRVLPHELGKKEDTTRMARHESTAADRVWNGAGEEAIDYGLWWHETMEFLPWSESDDRLDAYLRTAERVAIEKGFGVRATEELEKLRRSAAWAALRGELGEFEVLTELAVFAPKDDGAWIDGVIDLVVRKTKRSELWVVDWKTNARRIGEPHDALLGRLADEYRLQLNAYAQSLERRYPQARVRRWLYSSAAGDWIELEIPC